MKLPIPPASSALALFCALATVSDDALAHSNSVSYSIWTLVEDQVELYVEIDALDVRESVLVDEDRDGVLSRAEALRNQGRIAGLLDGRVRLLQGTLPCEATGPPGVEVPSPPQTLFLRQNFRCPARIEALRIELTLHEAIRSSAHRNLARFNLPMGASAQSVFAGSAPSFSLNVLQPDLAQVRWETLKRYGLLGSEHIATGYDHLLFLAALLLVGPGLRALLAIVTSFTLAHALTLALATLDVVSLPGPFVESLIALSIVYVALENILGVGARWRWVVAGGFGLVHGFGFSSVLSALGLAPGQRAFSLLGFNLGVELGQLAAVIPFFVLTHRQLQDPGPRIKRLLFGANVGILLLAGCWFVQRALLC